MSIERGEPETYIEDDKKANHEAILEDYMRDQVKKENAKADAYAVQYEETGNDNYQKAAVGQKIFADNYEATINKRTDELGAEYDEMTAAIDKVRQRAEGYEGPEADRQRAIMEEHVQKAMAKYGLIGSATELYIPGNNSAWNFVRDDEMRQAMGHAQQSQTGFKKAA